MKNSPDSDKMVGRTVPSILRKATLAVGVLGALTALIIGGHVLVELVTAAVVDGSIRWVKFLAPTGLIAGAVLMLSAICRDWYGGPRVNENQTLLVGILLAALSSLAAGL